MEFWEDFFSGDDRTKEISNSTGAAVVKSVDAVEENSKLDAAEHEFRGLLVLDDALVTLEDGDEAGNANNLEEHRDEVPVMQSGAVVPVDLQAVDIESIDIIPTAAATAEVISGTVGNHASNKGDTEGNDSDNRSNLGEHHVAIRGLFVEHLGSGRVRGEH